VDDDMDLFSDVLSMLEDTACDFNHFFYRLSKIPLFSYNSGSDYQTAAEHILPAEMETTKRASIEKLATWLESTYRPRLEKDGSIDDVERSERMKKVNPKFVLRQWILEEIIAKTKSEKGVGVQDKEMLDMVLKMVLEPFREEWGFDKGEEERLCGDVPKIERGFQCSCSS
jgi:serine/tyrosine/threonine adenylyltransferase